MSVCIEMQQKNIHIFFIFKKTQFETNLFLFYSGIFQSKAIFKRLSDSSAEVNALFCVIILGNSDFPPKLSVT